MGLNSTLYLKGFLNKHSRAIAFAGILLSVNSPLHGFANHDSSHIRTPAVIDNLEQCRIPNSMITRIRHMTPNEIGGLDEEFQQTAVLDDGENVVRIVRFHFLNDHIKGMIKQVPLDNTNNPLNIDYIDIPVEWMCIPPKPDEPYHFASSIADLKALQQANGCLGWVQRDSEVRISYNNGNEAKKSKASKNK